MSQILVDTDILIDFLRGKPDAMAWLDNCSQPPLVSTVTVAELHAGLRDGEEGAMEALLSALGRVTIDDRVARLAGRLRREYGPSHGTGLADAMIAASAVIAEARLVTRNARHYPMLERLVVPY